MKENLKMRRLRNYILLFFLILIPLIVLNNYWKGIDYAIYKKVYLNIPDEDKIIRTDITIIDIPRKINHEFNREDYRNRLTNLLDKIHSSAKKPKAVIIDVYFSTDSDGLDDLKKAILKLKDEGVKVYGVFNTKSDTRGSSFEDRKGEMDAELYDNIFDGGRLHSLYYEREGILNYNSLLSFKKEDGNFETIISLPFKVSKDYDPVKPMKKSDSTIVKIFILPLRYQKDLENLTYNFTNNPSDAFGVNFKPFDSLKNLNQKHIIIGSLKDDIESSTGIPGPFLLAWALNDQLDGGPKAKQPLNSAIVILAMVLFFSFFVTIIFALIFKYVKSLQTKPWVIALLSFLAGMILLVVSGYFMFILNYVIPVGLSILCMLLVSILGRHYYNKFLVTRIAEGSKKHDVFISYSHGDKDWVKEHLYQPLCEFTKPDGSKLDIFFDEKSIINNDAFTSKYMWGIVDSKLFIPVMSEEYNKKDHCKNEMDLAYTRKVEKKIKIFTIAFSFDFVPEIYHKDLITDITVQKDFIESLKKQLI